MRIVTKQEFMMHREEFFEKIVNGAVFVYPTDTIYGLGCNAQISKAVKRVRELKQRPDQPFSVIAPDKEWIYDNCDIGSDGPAHIEKLPGPYTLIFKLLNKDAVAEEVMPGLNDLGVRIPEHWFTKISTMLDIPIVTTSANVAGDNYMTSIDDMDDRIKNHVDFIIYEEEKEGKPSQVINLAGESTSNKRLTNLHSPLIHLITF